MTATYLSDHDVAARFSIGRATVWRWVKQNEFPEPIKLSKSCTRWRLEDIEAWELRRASAPAPDAA